MIVSTKLMLKDWLTVDKRMGTGDFWWGYLGMYLLTIIVSVIMGAVLAESTCIIRRWSELLLT